MKLIFEDKQLLVSSRNHSLGNLTVGFSVTTDTLHQQSSTCQQGLSINNAMANFLSAAMHMYMYISYILDMSDLVRYTYMYMGWSST